MKIAEYVQFAAEAIGWMLAGAIMALAIDGMVETRRWDKIYDGIAANPIDECAGLCGEDSCKGGAK